MWIQKGKWLHQGSNYHVGDRLADVETEIKSNSTLNGIIPQQINTGVKANNGADVNNILSETFGSIFSLHNNFIASATVCKQPHKPTLFGPFLWVKNPKSFLSASTKKITTIKSAAATMQKGIK